MDKFAQERSFLNKLREKVNISGKILENLNPEFAEMMEKLRTVDEKIRSQAADVKPLVRAAKSNANRRDYLTAATNISAFHERCRLISAILQNFISNVDLKHYKFILDQFDDHQKEQLFGYNPNKEITIDEAAVDDKVITAALKKQAGLSDWWFRLTDPVSDVVHNTINNQGIAMKALEKRFSVPFLKSLRSNTFTMVARTEKLLQQLLTIFRHLATALAKKNVGLYMDAAKIFIRNFANYHKDFVFYYDKNIVPLKEQHQKLMEAEKEEMAKAREKIEQDINLKNQPEAAPNFTNKPEPSGVRESANFTPSNPVPLKVEEDEEEKNIPIPLTNKKSNLEFIQNIEKFANDPQKLTSEILRYSEYLEDINPTLGLQLLAVAEGLIEDYKTAGIFDFLKKDQTQQERPEEKKETNLPFELSAPEHRKKPLEHNIPEGRVDKKFSSIPALANIQIKTTSGAARHISTIFVKRLYDLNLDAGKLDNSLERNIIEEIIKAIPRGIVLYNHKSDDNFNPLDRQLEIYTYLNLKDVDQSFSGIAKIRVLCRLSLSTGSLSLRTIDKTFSVG